MSVNLSIINNLNVTPQGGSLVTAKQGTPTSAFLDPYNIVATGQSKQVASQLATATVITIYDDSVDSPTDFIYMHYWADQTTYLQAITAATNFVLKLGAYIPFCFGGFNAMLAAANTNVITGAATPSTADIKKVLLGNYSGTTVNYVFTVVL